MQVDNAQKQYNLSREAASKLLKVSMRTLDRYLGGKKLSSQLVNGRIWLNKEEIDSLLHDKNRAVVVDKVDMSTSKMSIGVHMDNVDNMDSPEQDAVDILSSQPRKISQQSGSGNAYKKLFEELRDELREKQERLEIANYRVGQLEAQVRNSIPMLEYHRENFEKQRVQQELSGKLEESTSLIKQLYLKIKYESFGKKLFLIILLGVLALQPLWLLLRDI
ncbi:hypothetical protein HYW82_00740 [Candidatus Peregrinibacteria bacterium]|nr:hypothetical protein [Candidatus Peregrinibacteria bacterium]